MLPSLRCPLLPLLSVVLSLVGCALPQVERASKARAAEPLATEMEPPPPLDPREDPANRYEDLATFQTLVPQAHVFAEWPMPDTAPAPPHNFKVSGNVAVDSVTKLRWQRELPATYPGCTLRHTTHVETFEEGSGCSWQQAQSYCASAELAEALGGGRWRLPTRIELESILDPTRDPAIPPLFESDQDDFYWTSSPAPNPDGVKLAWAVDFTEGYSYVTGRFKAGRVRCVSSEADSGSEPNFEAVGKHVVDWNTRLTWQRMPDSATRTWEDARAYCETLRLENARWRLPSLKELLTIVDTRRSTPSLETRAFVITQHDRYWTSTAFVMDEAQAFTVEFHMGESAYVPRSDQHYVRCVQ